MFIYSNKGGENEEIYVQCPAGGHVEVSGSNSRFLYQAFDASNDCIIQK